MSGYELSQRDKQHMWLEGCLSAAGGSDWFPATEERRYQFQLGVDAVKSGHVVIRDIPALEAHIEDVKSGRWPPENQF